MGGLTTIGRTGVRIALGVAMLGALVADAGAQGTRDARRDGQRVDTTFAFAADGTLEIRMPHVGSGSADVTVTGWSRNEVRIIGETDEGELTIDASGRTLDIGTRSYRGQTQVERLEVSVPQGTRVRINNGGGDITAHNIRGGLEVSTFNGDVDARDLGNRVEVKTFNGDITIANVNGRLFVNASNGDVDLRNVQGEIEVNTLNGDIDMGSVTSRHVKAKTMSGQITYDGTIDPAGEYELNAFSGEIDMLIPRNTGATLTVSTFSGTIDSPDFPLTLQPSGSRESRGKSMTFNLGNGGARISLESFSGEIRIRERRPGGEGN